MHQSLRIVWLSLFVATPSVAQQGGALISADPVVETPAGMQAWKIRYWTTDDGEIGRAHV